MAIFDERNHGTIFGRFVRTVRCIERAKRKVSSKQRQEVCHYVGCPTFRGKARICRRFARRLPCRAVNTGSPGHCSMRGGGWRRNLRHAQGEASCSCDHDRCFYPGNLDAKRDWGPGISTSEGMWRILQPHELTILCSRLARHSRSQVRRAAFTRMQKGDRLGQRRR